MAVYLGQARIVIDQATLGPGQPGVSRDDGVLAQVVTLRNYDNTNITTDRGGWSWELEVPRTSAAVLSAPSSAVTTFTPDVDGTYKITLRVNQGLKSQQIAEILFAVRDSGGYRYPAQGEAAQANWLSAYTGSTNTTGWWEDLIKILRANQPAVIATMLTVTAEPALVNSRQIVMGTGLSAVDTGPGGTYTINSVAATTPGTKLLPDVALQAENIITTRTVNASTRDAAMYGQVNLGSESVAAKGTTANYGTIGGGLNNLASGTGATISGGSTNTASSTFASVGGGSSNTSSANYAHVGGGQSNTAGAANATVGGGGSCSASGSYSTIAGGNSNTSAVAATYSTIGGGQSNQTNNAHATVGGGRENNASGSLSVVAGGGGSGTGNTASGTNSAVVGGLSNASGATGGIIGAGLSNTITAGGSYSCIGGGRENQVGASGTHAFIGGGGGSGVGNTATAANTVVCGGSDNDATGTHAAVVGGTGNVNAGTYTLIGGGSANSIAAGCNYASIAGGASNSLDANGDWSFVGGGSGNSCLASYGAVGSGTGNSINAGATYAALVGGRENQVSGTLAFIGGGGGSGVGNTATAANTVVCGGSDNDATATHGTVCGGNACTTAGDYSFIGGGQTNSINGSGDYGSIPGGRSNSVTAQDGHAWGRGATAANTGAIVINAAGANTQSSSATNEVTIRGDGNIRNITNAGKLQNKLGATTSNNYVEYLQGNFTSTDASVWVTTVVTVPTDSDVTITVSLKGKQDSSNNCKALYYVGTYTNNGGTVALVGSAHVNSTQNTAGAAGWTCTTSISGANIRVNYTGAAGTTIYWSWEVKIHYGGRT